MVFGPATALQKRQSWLPGGVTCNEADMKLGSYAGGDTTYVTPNRPARWYRPHRRPHRGLRTCHGIAEASVVATGRRHMQRGPHEAGQQRRGFKQSAGRIQIFFGASSSNISTCKTGVSAVFVCCEQHLKHHACLDLIFRSEFEGPPKNISTR